VARREGSGPRPRCPAVHKSRRIDPEFRGRFGEVKLEVSLEWFQEQEEPWFDRAEVGRVASG